MYTKIWGANPHILLVKWYSFSGEKKKKIWQFITWFVIRLSYDSAILVGKYPREKKNKFHITIIQIFLPTLFILTKRYKQIKYL